MQHTTSTPLDIDHVIAVIGRQRFIDNFHLPMEEWGLTDREMARLAHPEIDHAVVRWYSHTVELFEGHPVEFIVAECSCGQSVEGVTYREVYSQHDRHTGWQAVHVHTADMLEG